MKLIKATFLFITTILLLTIFKLINANDNCPDTIKNGARNACEYLNLKLLLERNNENHNTVKRDNNFYNQNQHNQNIHQQQQHQHHHHQHHHHHQNSQQQQQQQHDNNDRLKNEVTYDESNKHQHQHIYPTRVRKHGFPKHGYLIMDRYYAKYLKSLNKGYVLRPHPVHLNSSSEFIRQKRDENNIFIDYCCLHDCSREFCGSK